MANAEQEIFYTNTWLQPVRNLRKFTWELQQEISNNASATIKNVSTTVLMVMTKDSPNTFRTSKKSSTKPQF